MKKRIVILLYASVLTLGLLLVLSCVGGVITVVANINCKGADQCE